MQIRCTNCGSHVPVADTGVLPPSCPHCQQRPVPDQLGRFRVVRLLAAGGMGEVYLGEHCELATRVALKLLPVPNGVDAAVVRERFRREAKLAAAIDHPGVVQVLDLAEDRGRMYLVLELVDGTSLRSRLRHGALPAAEAVRIAAAAAEVLGRAHAHGVVHRDVKPENVMLCRDGRVRVLDFGIARALQDQEPLTRTGEILGTPEYMAPEQLLESSEAVDARTDVHALAVLTWELLTGRSPFAGTSMFQALKLVESLVPPPPSRVGAAVPAAVDAVVLRGLSKDRGERFADGAEFAAALRAALPGAAGAGAAPVGAPARAPRRRRLWPVLLLGSALIVGTSWCNLQLRQLTAPAPARDPRAELAALLTSPAPGPEERELLREAVAAVGPATDGATLHATGLARLRLGAFQRALADLDRAARLGVRAARPTAAVAWHCVYTLLPAAIGAPAWFGACDRLRRDRLLGLGEGPADDDPLLLACRQLAQDQPLAAWQRLGAVPAADWTQEHGVVALLAARAACADPPTVRSVAARLAARFPAPAVQLAAAEPAVAGPLLQGFAADAEPAGADRWLFEFGALAAAALADGSAPPRLRAAAELAWLTGAGNAAPFWLAAVRACAGSRGAAPDAAEAARLQALIADLPVADVPALPLVQGLLDLASGEATARARLRSAGLPADAACALFRHWAAADAAAAKVYAAILGRGDVPPLELPPPADVAGATACALAAAGDAARDADGAARRRAHWLLALQHGADFASLGAIAPLPAPSGSRGGPVEELVEELVALLAEQGTASPPSPGLVDAVRFCARAGADLGELRERLLPELSHGIQ